MENNHDIHIKKTVVSQATNSRFYLKKLYIGTIEKFIRFCTTSRKQEIVRLNQANELLREKAALLKDQVAHLMAENDTMSVKISSFLEVHSQFFDETTIANGRKNYLKEINSKLIDDNALLPEKISSLVEINSKIIDENAILYSKLSILREINSKLIAQKDSWEKVSLPEVAGMLNWPQLLKDAERTNGFTELARLLSLFSNEESLVNNPSSCWVLLATKNCDQLLSEGYNNFKRTIGHNYFNFLVQEGDPQIQTVESLLTPEVIENCRQMALSIPNDPSFNTEKQFSYYYFVLLLWEYTKKIDTHCYLEQLEEPKEGNPIVVTANEKSMSQDLANSLIEYYSINEHLPFQHINTVLEIGGGYGRNAHVILSLNPHAKVVLVDILPALYIAQRYLSSVFKDRKIFKAKSFTSYDEIKNEMEEASIIFLLPHQLSLLPNKFFDLSMNISSLAEMTVEQIQWYFTQINRLTRQCFYTKQWDVSKNPFDGLELKKSDYPYPNNWQPIYSRNCAVQNEFHETLYKVIAS